MNYIVQELALPYAEALIRYHEALIRYHEAMVADDDDNDLHDLQVREATNALYAAQNALNAACEHQVISSKTQRVI